MPAHPEVEAYVYNAAIRRGIDPATALKVSRAEALNVFDPNKPDMGGDEGSSFGPYQLHYAGMSKSMPNAGLGDEFTARTGLDARDPSTWRQQIDFSLDWAAQNGWGSWMGAQAAGVGDFDGIPGKGPGGGGTASPSYTGAIAAPGGTAPADDDGGPAQAMADAIAMQNALRSVEARQPKSLLADTMASSVGKQTSGSGGLSPSAADQDIVTELPDFALATPEAAAPETIPPTASGAAGPETGLAELFKVKDIGLPNEIDPLTGQPRPFRSRRAYG